MAQSQRLNARRGAREAEGRKILASAALGAVLVAIRNRWGRSSSQDPRDRTADGQSGGRGRSAEKPTEIPALGWKDILWRVKDEVTKDNLSAVAAGVAFYALLAIVPALGAMVSIYGLVADVQDVEQQIAVLAPIMPGEALEILREQLHRIASEAGTQARCRCPDRNCTCLMECHQGG